MGFFDEDREPLFGPLFDFDGDGKVPWDEEMLAYKIFNESIKEQDKDLYSELFGYDDDFDDDWRQFCEDGTDLGVDPEDYETEEEYEEALDQAWENFGEDEEDGTELGVDPENYETKEEYEGALDQARNNLSDYEKGEIARCRFIRDNADTILAAKYLTQDGKFLYAQAIKDNFSLPCSLPDESEKQEMEFPDILCKIAKRDIPLSLEIWSWCLEQFLPYERYDIFCSDNLSKDVFRYSFALPREYLTDLVHYMSEHDKFCQALMAADSEPEDSMPELIVKAIQEKLYKTADFLFKAGLEKANNEWKRINNLTHGSIIYCKNSEELESIEYFRDNLLPLVKAIPIGMVQDEIAGWEEEIAEYINRVEEECEKYAFSRKNAWRKNVPDGKEYGLNPLDYDTEQEYLEDLNEEKYGWRKSYRDRQNFGLNIDSFETQEEYLKAIKDKAIKEIQQNKQQLAEQRKAQGYENEKMVYTYCGVILPFSSYPYSFLTEDKTIQIGDKVIVPIGDDEKETEGIVVSVGQYLKIATPYPVEKTKTIIRKAEDENNGQAQI